MQNYLIFWQTASGGIFVKLGFCNSNQFQEDQHTGALRIPSHVLSSMAVLTVDPDRWDHEKRAVSPREVGSSR
jgi:hypothetical protein